MPPKKSGRGRKKEVMTAPVAEQMNSEGTEDPIPTGKRGKSKQMENDENLVNCEASPSNGLANGHADEVQPPPAKKRGRQRNVPQQSVEATEKNGSDAVDESAKGDEADEPQSDEGRFGQARVDRKPSQDNRDSQEKSEQELETKETAPKKGKGRPRKQDAKSVEVPEQTNPEVSQVGQDSDEKPEQELETKETAPKKGKGRTRKQDAKSVEVPEQTKPEVSQLGQDSDEKPEQELETKETAPKKGKGRPRRQDAKLVTVPEMAEQEEPQQEVEQETTSKKARGRKQENASKKSSKEEPVIESRGGLKRKAGDPSSIVETKILQVSLLRQKSVDDMALEELKREGKVKGAVGPSKPGRKRGREGGEDAAKPSKATKAAPSSLPKKGKIPDVSALDFSNTSTTKSGETWNLKIASWNINGVRAWLEKDGVSYLHEERPDVLCVQETKCSKEKLPKEANIEGYHCYWLAGDKEGYSGIGLLSKQKPLAVEYGIGVEEFDAEGRVIMADFDKFYLVAAYVPNAGRGLVRLEDRKRWDVDFRAYLKKLDATKPVILCGDLNVAHKEIDLANPKTNKKNAGFTQEERDGFSTLLSEGFVDTYRTLYPDKVGAYTFWTYMMNARAKNVGWRLDYFLMSERFADRLCDCVIRSEVMGSDHCPLVLFLNV